MSSSYFIHIWRAQVKSYIYLWWFNTEWCWIENWVPHALRNIRAFKPHSSQMQASYVTITWNHSVKKQYTNPHKFSELLYVFYLSCSVGYVRQLPHNWYSLVQRQAVSCHKHNSCVLVQSDKSRNWAPEGDGFSWQYCCGLGWEETILVQSKTTVGMYLKKT